MGGSIVQRLELEGWDVSWWQTGREAVDAVPRSASDLDLIVCDIRLPDMSGVGRSSEKTALLQSLSFM